MHPRRNVCTGRPNTKRTARRPIGDQRGPHCRQHRSTPIRRTAHERVITGTGTRTRSHRRSPDSGPPMHGQVMVCYFNTAPGVTSMRTVGMSQHAAGCIGGQGRAALAGRRRAGVRGACTVQMHAAASGPAEPGAHAAPGTFRRTADHTHTHNRQRRTPGPGCSSAARGSPMLGFRAGGRCLHGSSRHSAAGDLIFLCSQGPLFT